MDYPFQFYLISLTPVSDRGRIVKLCRFAYIQGVLTSSQLCYFGCVVRWFPEADTRTGKSQTKGYI